MVKYDSVFVRYAQWTKMKKILTFEMDYLIVSRSDGVFTENLFSYEIRFDSDHRKIPSIDRNSHPILSLIPSFSLPDVLCDPNGLILRKGTSFEAMTGRRLLHQRSPS